LTVIHDVIVRFSAALVAVWAIVGCSPTYNWRQLSLDTAQASALMPCKPEASARMVPLATPPVSLEVRACDTDGFTFAVAWVVLPDGADATAALANWRRAAAASVKAVLPDTPESDWSVKGSDTAQRWQASGQRAGGERVEATWGYARKGQTLVQMAVYGPEQPSAVINQFWDGFAWQK
jgi:hypothetical protein